MNITEKPKSAKLPSAFRVFLIEKWMQHKDELMAWEKRLPDYDEKYYFRKHRWMLRRMFKEETQNKENV